MHFDKINRTPVGADSSRPAPIYRLSLDFRYPDEKVKQHHLPIYPFDYSSTSSNEGQ
jgi:hypothetical protein